jgi:hypothetical protein
MPQQIDHALQLRYAFKMFEIKGFKPDIVGDQLYLLCWNEELTEAYHVGISDQEIEFQAHEYLNLKS